MIHDTTYLTLLENILENGIPSDDRTGTGTLSTFGACMEFDISESFPLITTKRVHWPSVVWELLWMIRGETNVRWLEERGVTIWSEWADANGDLGPVYGSQWRNFGGVDQLKDVIERIKTNPYDRRLVVSAWNPPMLPQMALPPCHMFFQFYVRGGALSCQMYQRSCDMFLGVPFNIASYSLLTYIVAHLTGLRPGRFIWVGGDAHIYKNHIEQVTLQLARQPRSAPTLRLEGAPNTLDGDWGLEHFVVEGYNPHPGIKAPVAV